MSALRELTPSSDGDGLRTIARVMALLRALAAATPKPMRLVDLSAAACLHKATARRLLIALTAEGLVERTARGFELGPEVWLLGQAAATKFDLRDIAAASLERVATETDDVALLSVIVGTNAHCIARTEGNYPILPTSIRPGAVRPLGCGGHALALLAAMPDDQIARALATTRGERERDYPVITDEYLRRKIAETRQNGFASAGGEIVQGMAAISMVAFDPWRRPIAALTCTAVASRLQADRLPAVIALLRSEVAQIEAHFRRSVCTPSSE
jgi:DNA-binding IclR family transcriptional regulator